MNNPKSPQWIPGSILEAYGHSETRLVRYVSDFDGSYCYEELEEGYNNLHQLLVANVYDQDFDDWLPNSGGEEDKQ